MEKTTPPTTNKKTYGTTTTEPSPPRTSLTRNEVSIGGTTTTNESEPLLGERWLHDDPSPNQPPNIPPNHQSTRHSTADEKPFYTDASTIDKDDSTTDGNTSDPHIGLNVFTGNDTLSYSRDDSTLGDRYFRSSFTPRGSLRDVGIDETIEEEDDNKWLNCLFEGSRQVYFLVCFGLAVGIALCSVAALVYIEYWRHYGVDVLPDMANGTSGDESVNVDGSWHLPFARVARESFGDKVSNVLDVELFHPSLLYRENLKRAMQGESLAEPFFKFAFPTGAFWTNLVLKPVGSRVQTQHGERKMASESQYSYPIVAYPYSFQWSSAGKLQASYSAARRTIKPNSIQDAFAPDISFGSIEDITTRNIFSFDSLSVTLRFYADDSSTNSGFWESYIVQGSPYATARYYGLTPELTALSDFKDIACPPTMNQLKVKSEEQSTLSAASNSTRRRKLSSTTSATGTDTAKMLGICDVSDDSTQHSKIITGVQFIVTTKEGLTWLVFVSEPITFVFDQNARHTIASKDLFGGVIRVALVPPALPSGSDGSVVVDTVDVNYLASSPGVKRLIYHADTYPIGGSVKWDFRSGTRSSLASTIVRSSNERRKLFGWFGQTVTASTALASTKDSNIGAITFQFDVMHMTKTQSSKVSLLTLALPHHAVSISSAEEMLLQSTDFDLNYYSIKGKMTPVVGNSWTYEEELTSIAFGDEPVAKSTQSTLSTAKATTTTSNHYQTISEVTAVAALDESVRDLILDTVATDIKLNLPDNNGGAYSFGKQIARLAQLAHVAERVEAENGAASTNSKNSSGSGTSTKKTYALLQMYLTMWLMGDDGSSGSLVYDASLGGILSKEGMKDPYSDFGNGRYNDHHFHYGYVLYAAAILGRRNPQFISQYGAYIDAIFYDVAHNSNQVVKSGKRDEAYFPLARHKSWFDGHSFASGLFPFADGKSQESSSEATNCYYGAYLWSKVRWGGTTDGNKLVNFARLLLATELTGAKTYWHMVPSEESSTSSSGRRRLPISNTTLSTWQPPAAYNSMFSKNYMVGNLGMTDVTCTTWFGTENIYVHLINFMPVTAITSELFNRAYVKEERKVLTDGVAVDSSWKGYAICHKAILDPNEAWIEAQELISNQLDPGLSKSQVLYWISTRIGFSLSTTAEISQNNDPNPDDTTSSQTSESSSTSKSDAEPGDSSCESHASCSALNLSGQCCPTDEGVILGCCN